MSCGKYRGVRSVGTATSKQTNESKLYIAVSDCSERQFNGKNNKRTREREQTTTTKNVYVAAIKEERNMRRTYLFNLFIITVSLTVCTENQMFGYKRKTNGKIAAEPIVGVCVCTTTTTVAVAEREK